MYIFQYSSTQLHLPPGSVLVDEVACSMYIFIYGYCRCYIYILPLFDIYISVWYIYMLPLFVYSTPLTFWECACVDEVMFLIHIYVYRCCLYVSMYIGPSVSETYIYSIAPICLLSSACLLKDSERRGLVRSSLGYVINGGALLPLLSVFSESCTRLGRWGASEGAGTWPNAQRRHLQNRRTWWAGRCRTAGLEEPVAGLQEPAINHQAWGAGRWAWGASKEPQNPCPGSTRVATWFQTAHRDLKSIDGKIVEQWQYTEISNRNRFEQIQLPAKLRATCWKSCMCVSP